MGDRYGRSEINEISIGISIWDMCYRFGLQYIDMVIYHIDMVIYHSDMVILNIDMGDEATDMGDDRIDTDISHIDLGYLVTLPSSPASGGLFELYGLHHRRLLRLLCLSGLVPEPLTLDPVSVHRHTMSKQSGCAAAGTSGQAREDNAASVYM